MPRLTNKGFTGRAPQTAGSVPELPDFSPQLAEIPGGMETNAALQRWWDLVSQRIEFNNAGTAKRFFEVKAEFTSGDSTLSAEIVEERIVRADADAALAVDILTVTATVDGLSATVTVLASALATAEDYLEARWMLNVTAGNITTGMTLFSASGPDTEVSYIAFQADRFQINTASGGRKVIFSATGAVVKLGDVLTVDLTNAKMFIGTGTYGNSNTAFYVDDDGYFSLMNKLTFDPTGAGTLTMTGTIIAGAGLIGGWVIGPTYIVDVSGLVGLSSAVSGVDDIRFWAGNITAGSAPFRVTEAGVLTATSGTVGGWTLSSTTLSASNVIISNAGTIALGTSNDILIMSAAGDIRLWAGNATAASASFSVTKAGALWSTSGTIGGFTIGATSLEASGLHLFAGLGSITAGVASGGQAAIMTDVRIGVSNSIGASFKVYMENDGSNNGRIVLLNAASSINIILDGSTGDVEAESFTGLGSALTALNASNISNGTLANARLPSAISVTTLESSGAGTFGSINIGATEIVTSGRQLNSAALNCDDTNGSKCNFLANTVGGADSVFAAYLRIFMNGGTAYIPYRATAP